MTNKKTPLLLAIEKALPSTRPITIPRDFTRFCESMPLETGQTFGFSGREFLKPMCQDDSRQIVIVKGRQTGITTWIIGKIIHNALLHPKTVSLYCTDTYDHATKFSQDRLDPILDMFGMARHASEKKISRVVFPNGSILYVISGYSNFKQARSIPADFVYLDEAQHLPLDTMANIKEAMAQSIHKKLIIAGTGDWEGSPWHKYYSGKTSCMEWQDGHWVKYGKGYAGYHISQELLPNITDADLAEKKRDYSASTYQMEVLGNFTTGAKIPLPYGMVIKSYSESLSLLSPAQIDRTLGKTYATIDWAGSSDGASTVLTITQELKDGLQVIHLEQFQEPDVHGLGQKVADRISEYRPDHTFCDIGGNIGAMQVLESNHKIIKVSLGEHPQNTITAKTDQDTVVVDKSTYIQRVIQWFESQSISIPLSENTEWSIDQLTSEEAKIITKSTGNTVQRFELMKNRHDDFLMTLVFLAVALDPNSPGQFKHYATIV